MRFTLIATLTIFFFSSKAQDVSQSGAYKDLTKDSLIFSVDHLSKFAFSSNLGTIQVTQGKYYLTDKDRRIEISQQLGDLLIKSYKRTPYEKNHKKDN